MKKLPNSLIQHQFDLSPIESAIELQIAKYMIKNDTNIIHLDKHNNQADINSICLYMDDGEYFLVAGNVISVDNPPRRIKGKMLINIFNDVIDQLGLKITSRDLELQM